MNKSGSEDGGCQPLIIFTNKCVFTAKSGSSSEAEFATD
jgi:hypothetical protein